MKINRYQLISILIKELGMDEKERRFLSNLNDKTLLQHLPFIELRKGFYVI